MKNTNNKHGEIFNKIYDNALWGRSLDENRPYYSGGGSEVKYSQEWIDCVDIFIKDNNINTITDIGCGDFFVSLEILKRNLNVDYLGVDVSENLIYHNKRTFPKYNFEYNNPVNSLHIRNCDLIIIKDVLQHWENNHITQFLDYITVNKICKYILICNSSNQDNETSDCNYEKALENPDDPAIFSHNTGHPLTYKMKPLSNYNIELIETFVPGEDKINGQPKEISIIRN